MAQRATVRDDPWWVLAKSGEVSLHEYPNVMAWIERVQSRESYEASV